MIRLITTGKTLTSFTFFSFGYLTKKDCRGTCQHTKEMWMLYNQLVPGGTRRALSEPCKMSFTGHSIFTIEVKMHITNQRKPSADICRFVKTANGQRMRQKNSVGKCYRTRAPVSNPFSKKVKSISWLVQHCLAACHISLVQDTDKSA